MSIASNIHTYLAAIQKSCHEYGRDPKEVLLLAVSKKQTASAIREAHQAGLNHFGESYWQEARDKQTELQDLPLTWHFIGPMQSNKAKAIAKRFDWVHSVCRKDITEKLNQARPDDMPPLNICLQVNLDKDPNKSGVQSKEALLELVRFIHTQPKLQLRGLMTIPDKSQDASHTFHQLKTWFDELKQTEPACFDTLSMGMTEDFQAAIQYYSTCIRIGRGIFNQVQL